MKAIINFILQLLGIRVKSESEKELEAKEKLIKDDIAAVDKAIEKNKKEGGKSLEDEIKYWEDN